MGSFRLERVGNLIKELVSETLPRLKDPRIGFVSVTDVKVSPDLRYAKVFVSFFGDEQAKSDSLKALNNAKGYIKKEIAPELKLRRIPDLSFEPDDSIEYGVKMSALISQARMSDEKLHELNDSEHKSDE